MPHVVAALGVHCHNPAPSHVPSFTPGFVRAKEGTWVSIFLLASLAVLVALRVRQGGSHASPRPVLNDLFCITE